jgi:hypothetical protein
MRTRITTVLLLAATAALLAFQYGSSRAQSTPPGHRSPIRTTSVELGVTTGPLARNWWRPWTPRDLASVDAFGREAGKTTKIVMWYADWRHDRLPSIPQLNAVERRGSIPEITWEPWDASKRLYQPQPKYRLTNIIDGTFDQYIRSWARSLAAWGHPVLLRFAQEMDGNWFPWSDYGNGNRQGQFVKAWRHVHRIFAAAGATNVRWVWSPAFANPEAFPGARYVNVMATTCQNAGKPIFARGWQSFTSGCGKAIARLHWLDPRLPIQLAEASSAELGGSKARWIEGMFAYLAHHPEVTSLVWFNVHKGVDWRISSSASAEYAFSGGAQARWVN